MTARAAARTRQSEVSVAWTVSVASAVSPPQPTVAPPSPTRRSRSGRVALQPLEVRDRGRLGRVAVEDDRVARRSSSRRERAAEPLAGRLVAGADDARDVRLLLERRLEPDERCPLVLDPRGLRAAARSARRRRARIPGRQPGRTRRPGCSRAGPRRAGARAAARCEGRRRRGRARRGRQRRARERDRLPRRKLRDPRPPRGARAAVPAAAPARRAPARAAAATPARAGPRRGGRWRR